MITLAAGFLAGLAAALLLLRVTLQRIACTCCTHARLVHHLDSGRCRLCSCHPVKP